MQAAIRDKLRSTSSTLILLLPYLLIQTLLLYLHKYYHFFPMCEVSTHSGQTGETLLSNYEPQTEDRCSQQCWKYEIGWDRFIQDVVMIYTPLTEQEVMLHQLETTCKPSFQRLSCVDCKTKTNLLKTCH